MYAESNGYVSWQLEKLLFSQAKGFCLGGGGLHLTSNALKTIENILFEQKLTFRKAH